VTFKNMPAMATVFIMFNSVGPYMVCARARWSRSLRGSRAYSDVAAN